MKKILTLLKPIPMAFLSLLIVSLFLRYYLYISTNQTVLEFKNQNFRELYSADILKLSSRLNSLSSAINWVCISASTSGREFYKSKRGTCQTGIFKQRFDLKIPEANNTNISLTLRLPNHVETLFAIFMIMQGLLIAALILSTKKSEEEKRKYEITLSKIARQMSHDIRSPLATLNTLLDDLRDLPVEKLSIIEKSIERINDVANSLLRETKSSLPPKLVTANVSNLLQEIIEEKNIEYHYNNRIKLTCDISSDDPHAFLDPIEFKRIISNLINNSVEAIKNDFVEIEIKVFLENRKILITLKDNGIGIPDSILSQIGLSEITTKIRGNGLGLFHAIESIKSWGGHFHIESIMNQGTKISITLEQKFTASQKTILLDDDELVRLTWSAKAKKKNINFEALKDPKELLEILNSLPRDTLFYIDSELQNGIKGEEIAKTLHSKGYLEIFMATGYEKEHFAHLSFLKGIHGKAPPWS